VQKPFPPHFARAVVEHVCKPKFEKPKKLQAGVPLHEICNVNVKWFQKEKIVSIEYSCLCISIKLYYLAGASNYLLGV